MQNLVQQIFEEEDPISEEEIANNAAIDGYKEEDLDSLDQEAEDIEELETEITQLGRSAIAIENFGINPTTYQVLKTTGLMSGTALESLALESIGMESYTSDNSQLAMEALLNKAKDKVVEWSSKIVSFFSNGVKKTLGVLGSIGGWIADKVKALGSASWEKAKDTGAYVKAHPYKTIAAVLAAAATVAAIIAFAGKFPTQSAGEGALSSFMTRMRTMIQSIKWPFGAIKTEYVVDGKVLKATVVTGEQLAKAEAKASMGTLGWSVSQVKAAGASVARTWATIKTSIGTIWNTVIKPVRFADKVGDRLGKQARVYVKQKTGSKVASKVAKFATKMAWGSIVFKFAKTIFNLVKAIVIKAFNLVKSTFSAIASFLA